MKYNPNQYEVVTTAYGIETNIIKYLRYIGPPDITPEQPQDCTSYKFMFHERNDIKFLDLTSWDFTGITDITSMFASCKNLEILRLNGCNMQDVKVTIDAFSSLESLLYFDLELSGLKYLNIRDITGLSSVSNAIMHNVIFDNVYDLFHCGLQFTKLKSLTVPAHVILKLKKKYPTELNEVWLRDPWWDRLVKAFKTTLTLPEIFNMRSHMPGPPTIEMITKIAMKLQGDPQFFQTHSKLSSKWFE